MKHTPSKAEKKTVLDAVFTPLRTRAGFADATGSANEDALARLLTAVDGLMEIVEGVRGERWSAKGKRLVDTLEWRELYVRWSKIHFAVHSPNSEVRHGSEPLPEPNG